MPAGFSTGFIPAPRSSCSDSERAPGRRVRCRSETAATSAYWKPPFYLLEDGIACQVVNARDVKNVPGAPRPASWMRCGCASSPSAACSGTAPALIALAGRLPDH
jgi:hypothetical protein